MPIGTVPTVCYWLAYLKFERGLRTLRTIDRLGSVSWESSSVRDRLVDKGVRAIEPA